MKKTLYSLVLNDEVVREVDALAHRMGTNRSNLINQILAEYVNYTTPEQRINQVLSTIEELMAPSRDLVPFFSPNSYTMSLKSSLEYKYRPTVKYEVELYRGAGDSIGELTVLFRTQSMTLACGSSWRTPISSPLPAPPSTMPSTTASSCAASPPPARTAPPRSWPRHCPITSLCLTNFSKAIWPTDTAPMK